MSALMEVQRCGPAHGLELVRREKPHGMGISRVRFAPGMQDCLAVASQDGALTVLSGIGSRKEERTVRLEGHTAAVIDFEWSMTGDRIVSVASDGSLRMWDVDTARALRELQLPSNAGEPSTCIFFPSNNNIIRKACQSVMGLESEI